MTTESWCKSASTAGCSCCQCPASSGRDSWSTAGTTCEPQKPQRPARYRPSQISHRVISRISQAARETAGTTQLNAVTRASVVVQGPPVRHRRLRDYKNCNRILPRFESYSRSSRVLCVCNFSRTLGMFMVLNSPEEPSTPREDVSADASQMFGLMTFSGTEAVPSALKC